MPFQTLREQYKRLLHTSSRNSSASPLLCPQSFQSFQSGADLWPSSITGSNGDLVNEIEEEEDVVELDFSNIKALDNLHSSTEKKVKPRVKSPNNSIKAAKPVGVKANGTSVPVNGSANPGNPRTVK